MNYISTTAPLEGHVPISGPQAGPHSRTRTANLLGAHVLVFALVIILPLFLSGIGFTTHDLIGYTAAFTLGTLAWCIWSWNYSGQSLFSPYGLLLLAAYLYHGGQFFLALFGLKTGLLGHIFNVFRFKDETLLATELLFLVGFGGCHLGALLAALRGQQQAEEQTPSRTFNISAQSTRLVGWLLIAIAIVPAIQQLQDLLALRLTKGYGAIWAQEQAMGLENWRTVLALALLPGALFLLAGSRGRILSIGVATACIAFQAAGYLLTGQRSLALLPLFGFAWVFHNCIRPLPKTFLALGSALLIFVFMPLVVQIRHMPLEQALSLDSLSQAYFSIENPALSFLDETGISAVTVCDTLELVPRRRPYSLGREYLNTAVSPITFLVPISFTGNYDEPGKWLVEARYAERVKKRMFLGYSFIGEAYLEFGWIGAPIALALIGWLVVQMTYWATAHNIPAKIAACGVIMASLPHFARGDTIMLGRPAFRYVLLPLLLMLLLDEFRRRTQPSREAGSINSS